MILTQSDVAELLDAIHAGGDIDVIRGGVELVLQALGVQRVAYEVDAVNEELGLVVEVEAGRAGMPSTETAFGRLGTASRRCCDWEPHGRPTPSHQ